MAIPGFQDFFAPVLKYMNDKNSMCSRQEILSSTIEYFQPTEEELNESIQSNSSSKFKSRAGWAIVYLKQAELIELISTATYQITDKGRKFLLEFPNFSLKELKKHTDFLINEKSKKKENTNIEENEEQENNSTVVLANEEYYETVELDLLERLKSMGTHTVDKGTQFEDICLDLLEKMGYGNKERTGGAGDRGVDGFLTTDRFGFDKIGIQCKCHSDNKINDDQITKFAHGLKNVNGLNKGIFVTTTDYTPSAKKVVEELKDIKIILINGMQLAKYMREYQIGVQVIQVNYVYDITIGEE